MFSVLSEGLQHEGPKSNMIAEPAQVVVMMPNSRVVKAETELRDLKSGLFVLGLGVVVVIVLGLYFFYVKSGSTRPSNLYSRDTLDNKKADLKDNILLAGPPQGLGQPAQSMQGSQRPQVPQRSQPDIKDAQPVHSARSPLKLDLTEDIVKIVGHIPVWGLEDKDIVETKVSESDENIAAMIRAREQLSKSLEKASEVTI